MGYSAHIATTYISPALTSHELAHQDPTIIRIDVGDQDHGELHELVYTQLLARSDPAYDAAELIEHLSGG